MNPYLKRLREQYDSLRTSIEGLQTRAADDNRDLTEEELRSVNEQSAAAKGLYSQIETLTEVETRNAKVADMTSRVAGSTAGQSKPAKLGGATTQDRDPGFYTRSSQFSYVGDQYRAATYGDEAAKERLTKHADALRDTELMRDVLGSGGGAGLVPPVWMAELFAPVLHRKLRLAQLVRNVPFSSPYAWTIPIAGTGATTATVAEGTNPTESDPTYTTITVTPSTITGYSEVSRQLLDASNPSVDSLIWTDMLGDFYDDCETQLITALEAQASVNAVTVADGAVALGARNGVLDAIAAVSDNNGGDPDVFVGRTSRWVQYLKLVDTAGRPLVTSQQYNPMNAIGEGNTLNAYRSPVQGSLEGLAVVTSPTVAANRGFVLNSQEIVFSNSSPQQFKFEQPAGPALIRVGVWGYCVTITGRRPKAITKITYTAN
ncbi:MAG TPA: phage major capsid protein [Pseudonocardia sp.]